MNVHDYEDVVAQLWYQYRSVEEVATRIGTTLEIAHELITRTMGTDPIGPGSFDV